VSTEYDFREEEVEAAIREVGDRYGLDWTRDVSAVEAHPIKGTLACRALLRLRGGENKVVLLERDRQHQSWNVKHFGPRLTDVLRATLQRFGRELPEDHDEKYEQPILGLDETTCRYLLVKRGVARVEATLVLEPARREQPWRVAFLKWNDEVLLDRTQRKELSY
jgi:hypothetical protein